MKIDYRKEFENVSQEIILMLLSNVNRYFGVIKKDNEKIYLDQLKQYDIAIATSEAVNILRIRDTRISLLTDVLIFGDDPESVKLEMELYE